MYVYGHGGNAVFEANKSGAIDLSASINPLGIPVGVRDAIIREITNCDRYPDSSSRKLRKKIADFEGVDPNRVFCGNGASDVIFRLPGAVRARKAMVAAPSFSDYERSSLSFGAEVFRYPLFAENSFDLDYGFLDSIRYEAPDLIFLCNPNNPTGRLIETGLIEEVLCYSEKTGAHVVVDECFIDFVEQSARYTSKVFLDMYPNLIILKAFTKTFALPGIRLGYAICADEKLISSLCYHGADWPVSNLAQAAGVAAFEVAESYIRSTVEFVACERVTMESRLSALGYNVIPASANYVLMQNPYSFCLYDELDKMGIRIRSCGSFHGLDDSYCRIAVSNSAVNNRLLSAVERITVDFCVVT